MISLNRSYNHKYIDKVTRKNKHYLGDGQVNFKAQVKQPNNHFYVLEVDNIPKGYYLIIDKGDGVFDCHLCVRKISPDLNYYVSRYILEYFKQCYGAKLFTTHTTDKNAKAKTFATKLGFTPIEGEPNNFELRTKNVQKTDE